MEHLQPSSAAINVFPRDCDVSRDRSSRWSVHLKRSLSFLLQRAAAARGAMSGLIADLMEERLRSLQVIAESDEARAEVAEMIDIVHGYLT